MACGSVACGSAGGGSRAALEDGERSRETVDPTSRLALTSARWRILAAIEAAPSRCRRLLTLPNSPGRRVQRVADVLVEDGLATHEDNPGHRRSKLLRITPRGRSSPHHPRGAARAG